MPKSIFEIDPDRLDEACLTHSEVYYEWAEKLAIAREDTARAKAALEVVEAELTVKLHKDPEIFGLDKAPTIPVAKALILSNKKYIAANDKLHEANLRTAMIQAKVSALDHRKRMITLAVELHLANYRSTPRIPSNSRDAMTNNRKSSVRSSLRREEEPDEDEDE